MAYEVPSESDADGASPLIAQLQRGDNNNNSKNNGVSRKRKYQEMNEKEKRNKGREYNERNKDSANNNDGYASTTTNNNSSNNNNDDKTGAPEVDLEAIEAFAHRFRSARVKMGLAQKDVGAMLGRIYGNEFSQSTVCRFESLALSFKNMLKLMPMMNQWLDDMRQRDGHSTMVRNNQEFRRKYWATRSSVHLFARATYLFAGSTQRILLARSAALICSPARSHSLLCS